MGDNTPDRQIALTRDEQLLIIVALELAGDWWDGLDASCDEFAAEKAWMARRLAEQWYRAHRVYLDVQTTP